MGRPQTQLSTTSPISVRVKLSAPERKPRVRYVHAPAPTIRYVHASTPIDRFAYLRYLGPRP